MGHDRPASQPLADVADDALCIETDTAATVQEAHLVAVHLLCESFDEATAAPVPPAKTLRHAPGAAATQAAAARRRMS